MAHLPNSHASASASTSDSASAPAHAPTSDPKTAKVDPARVTSAQAPPSAPPPPKKSVHLVGELPRPPRTTRDNDDNDDADSDDANAPPPSSRGSSRGDVDRHVEEDDDDKDGEITDEDLLATFPPDEDVINLTHLRLTSKSLRNLGLSRFANSLQRLCLRQNQISKIRAEDVGCLHELLELDLYDNALEHSYGDALRGCEKLETLDLSFNSLRHISHLNHLGRLETLYLVQNKISRVRPDDLTGPIAANLRSLELGGNRLRKIEHIDHLHNLEELWLGKNKITALENLDGLTKLRVLSIQSNRITKLENLGSLTALEELYISHNGLERIEGLEANARLTTLDVSGNRIAEVGGVDHLAELEEFWANDNQLATLQNLEDHLGPRRCPKLQTVYLENNPAQRSEGTAYRRKVMLALPQVRQIDATSVAMHQLRGAG